MGRDFTERELETLSLVLSPENRVDGSKIIMSIGLAGPVCGAGIFTERAFAIKTDEYKWMEQNLPLTHGGAGPYAHVIWREEQMQKLYEKMGYVHTTDWPQLAIDNGRDAVRQNPDGSVWRHEPDRKGLWLVSGPVKERYVYPALTPEEWDFAISTQSWPPGQIPEREKAHSFHVWN